MRLLSFLLLFYLLHLPVRAQDSTRSYNRPLHLSKAQLWAPVLLGASGLLLSGSTKWNLAQWRNENLPDFSTYADDVLAFSPIVIAYGLDAFGLKSHNDFWNRSAILCKGELMMLGSVYALKYSTHVPRPDGSDIYSFPSGHTAQAFMAATFLSQEYKHKIVWMPYAAYTLAASVGALRIANNKHYISDVLVGAGLGILAQKVAYWTHQYRWGRHVPKPIFTF
ncbi:MAG: phosphatase PAP2 family protein [Phycisphaerales bacterium]|nr:phosphatase PAP2 family protein [Phycisphaerales bacterium]